MLRITVSGRRRFFEWLESGVGRTGRSIRQEFPTRLYFTQLHRPENLAQLYKAQCTEIETIVGRLESLLEHLPPGQIFNRFSLELRLQNWMAEIQRQFGIAAR